MNLDLINPLLERISNIDPPGCCSDFLDHPFPPYRSKRSVEIGFVIEHQFAFYYWLKCKRELMYDRRSRTKVSDEEFQPPDLITWDWHDDSGGSCDYSEDELAQLDQQNEEEIALFCWAGLRSLNDGHIAPAIWLNAIGNVYILQKQRDQDECEDESREQNDRYGRPHQILFFRSPSEMSEAFEETNMNTGVIWDIDMDFFTLEEPVDDQQYTSMMSKRAITAMLSPKKPWMPRILRDLRAITIALEPTYTGGLSRSLEIYSTWESALFETPVFDKECRWRADLFRHLAE